MTAKRRIVLLGGGFSWAPGSPLDAYVLRTAGRRRPKVCFVPTASGDAQSYVEDFHAAFAARDCEPAHLPLFRRDHRDLRSFVLSQDVVHPAAATPRPCSPTASSRRSSRNDRARPCTAWSPGAVERCVRRDCPHAC